MVNKLNEELKLFLNKTLSDLRKLDARIEQFNAVEKVSMSDGLITRHWLEDIEMAITIAIDNGS